MNGACNSQKKIAPSPGALGRGQKVKYHLILIAKSISKIFLPKLCIAISRQLPNLLSPRFFKKAKGISISPQSVCPLCYLLLNHWTKFNQVCSVSYWHEWGMQHQTIFWPRPLGPWGGVKRSNIIWFQLQSQFQRFLYQTLCVFSQMKDTKHIRQDFYSVPWVMPQGGTLRCWGVPWGHFFFQTWSCGKSNRRGWWAEQNAS